MSGPWEKYSQSSGKPWEKFKTQEPQRQTMSPEESALYGAGQGLTFNFSDEGLAGAKALYDKVTKGGDLGELYDERLKKERQYLDEARQDNPLSYFGGAAVGSLPTMAIPGLGIAKGASLGTQLGKAALQGGLLGAGESQSNPFESVEKAEQFAKDIGTGAATGAITQGVMSAAGGALNKLTPAQLKKAAEERAVKSITGQNISALRKMSGTTLNSAGDIARAEQGIRKAGRDILDEGVLGPLSDETLKGNRSILGALNKVEDLAPKLSAARQSYGQQIGEVGKQVDAAMPNAVNAKNIADNLVDYAAKIPETEAGKKLQERILAEAANFEKMGAMSFADAQAFKNQFAHKAVDADALISNKDATNKIRSIISKEMEDTAKTMSEVAPQDTKALLQRYQELKGKYGSFKGASDAATDRVQKNLTNRFISPSDYGVGSTAAILSGVATGGAGIPAAVAGALGAAANKFGRERGSALAARTADGLAKIMEKSPEAAQQFGNVILDAVNRGPAALVATHAMLMRRPEYKALFEGEK